jgi:hypothetical protein
MLDRIIYGVIGILAVLVIYSYCVVSGRSSRRDEKLEMLHNLTLNNCLNSFYKEGVEFIINDGYVIDYIV